MRSHYFPEYDITIFENGVVNNSKGTRVHTSDCYGYPRVYFQVNKKRKGFFVHRLLAIAFIPNPNNYETVNHKNGVKSDFSLDNLEWCTQRMNMLHAHANKLRKKPLSKVTRNKAIKDLLKSGWRQCDVARAFDISQVAVSQISKYEDGV